MTTPEVASLIASVAATVKAQRERDAALARLEAVRALLLDAEHEPRCSDAINEDCDCILADLAAVLDPTEGATP